MDWTQHARAAIETVGEGFAYTSVKTGQSKPLRAVFVGPSQTIFAGLTGHEAHGTMLYAMKADFPDPAEDDTVVRDLDASRWQFRQLEDDKLGQFVRILIGPAQS